MKNRKKYFRGVYVSSFQQLSHTQDRQHNKKFPTKTTSQIGIFIISPHHDVAIRTSPLFEHLYEIYPNTYTSHS